MPITYSDPTVSRRRGRRYRHPINLAQFLQQETVEVHLTRPVSPGAACFRLPAGWSGFWPWYWSAHHGRARQAEEPEGGPIRPIRVKSRTAPHMAIEYWRGWDEAPRSPLRRSMQWHRGTSVVTECRILALPDNVRQHLDDAGRDLHILHTVVALRHLAVRPGVRYVMTRSQQNASVGRPRNERRQW